MVERLGDMPDGTLGFRSTGALDADDYRNVIAPPIKEVVEGGGKVRVLFVVEGNIHETPGGVVEDIKTGAGLGAAHHAAWERTALVTDQDLVRKAVRMLGWLAPGEVKVFALDETEAARDWVSA